MDFWMPLICTPGDAVERLVETAQAAESAGFAGLALIDHVVIPTKRATIHPSGEDRLAEQMPFLDPFTTAAALAVATRELRFTSYSYVLPLRDPFNVAKQVTTAAILSEYRVVLGAGVGWFFEEMAAMGVNPRNRGRRVDEMLEIIEGFWADGYCEHHGAFFDFPNSAMFPVPQRRIPIWIGGMSDAALKRAARHDGWMSDAHPIEEVVQCLRTVHAWRDAAGQHGEFETMVAVTDAASPAMYQRLGDEGATSVITVPWELGNPDYVSFDARRGAIERFAERFID